MNKSIYIIILLLWSTVCLAKEQRIITLHSAITETVYALGLGSSMVATDVTSISPKAAAGLPRVSKNRSVSSEGLLAFQPTVVLAMEGDVPSSVAQHLRKSGVRFVTLRQEYSIKGASKFIQDIADALGVAEMGKTVVQRTKINLDRVLDVVKEETKGRQVPKVLFIYARGTGTMSVAGKGSSLDAIISLAGGKNAVQEFADFKPYTTEALVQANPDIILMFDFGASSLGGKDAILKLPGVRVTEAGRQERILAMSGPLLINFSTRLPEAIMQLHRAFVEEMD